MKTIKDVVVNEIVIEKSRFITYLFNAPSTLIAKEKIDEINKMHSDATHVVYGFINSIDERSNDNGEPKGTAGLPTIEVLRKNNLTDIIALTVRYFGGIKLGAGGLVRAYTKGVTEALKKATFSELRQVTIVSLLLSYKDSSYFDKAYNSYLEIKKEYSNNVKYSITLLSDKKDELTNLFINFKDEYEFNILENKEVFI